MGFSRREWLKLAGAGLTVLTGGCSEAPGGGNIIDCPGYNPEIENYSCTKYFPKEKKLVLVTGERDRKDGKYYLNTERFCDVLEGGIPDQGWKSGCVETFPGRVEYAFDRTPVIVFGTTPEDEKGEWQADVNGRTYSRRQIEAAGRLALMTDEQYQKYIDTQNDPGWEMPGWWKTAAGVVAGIGVLAVGIAKFRSRRGEDRGDYVAGWGKNEVTEDGEGDKVMLLKDMKYEDIMPEFFKFMEALDKRGGPEKNPGEARNMIGLMRKYQRQHPDPQVTKLAGEAIDILSRRMER